MTEHQKKYWTVVAFPQVFFWLHLLTAALPCPAISVPLCTSTPSCYPWAIHSIFPSRPPTTERAPSKGDPFPCPFLKLLPSLGTPTLWLLPTYFFKNYKRHHQAAARTRKKQAKHTTLPESQDTEITWGLKQYELHIATGPCPPVTAQLRNRYSAIACPPSLYNKIRPTRIGVALLLHYLHSTANNQLSSQSRSLFLRLVIDASHRQKSPLSQGNRS